MCLKQINTEIHGEQSPFIYDVTLQQKQMIGKLCAGDYLRNDDE